MAKLTRSGNICLLSSIFLVFIQMCGASSFTPREYEDGLDRNNMLEEFRDRSRLRDNALDDLQPEETEADRWSRAKGFNPNSRTFSLDDVIMKSPTREDENYNGDERKIFKSSVRGYNPQSAFRQRENANSRATLNLFNGLRKKSVKSYYNTSPQFKLKRQILFRQCFFNPISCF